MLGIVGRKVGMTRIFTEEGGMIPVTVIEAEPNRITRVISTKEDGYNALQITTGSKKPSRVNKALTGHYAKAETEAGRGLWEFRLEGTEKELPEVGGELNVDLFKEGQFIDVRGVSKGKGFQGGVKRHGFKMQDATHGNSLSHRAPGSIGQCQTPGRVFKGKKMAGHMGSANTCIQNLTIVKVDSEKNLILVKGAIPGANGGDVIVTPAIKKLNKG